MRFGIAGVVSFNEKRFHLCDGRAVFKIVIDDAADALAFDERKSGPARHYWPAVAACKELQSAVPCARQRNLDAVAL